MRDERTPKDVCGGGYRTPYHSLRASSPIGQAKRVSLARSRETTIVSLTQIGELARRLPLSMYKKHCEMRSVNEINSTTNSLPKYQ